MALFPVEAVSRREEPVEGAAPWITRLARLGYAAKGVVYVLVGGIAAQAAMTAQSRPEGSEGALLTILRQPLGQVLLGGVALGLAGYALWKLVQAVLDPDHKGTDLKGIAQRAGFAISAAIHAGLAFEAARMVMGSGGGRGQEAETDHWTALVMQQPLGRWVIALVGVGIAGFGLYELYKAYSEDFDELDLARQDPEERRWVKRLGRFGLAARGVVFGIIGWFLVQAALQYEPREARGLGGALQVVQDQRYGPWLLSAVALGLMAYGALEMLKARYRRIRPAE